MISNIPFAYRLRGETDTTTLLPGAVAEIASLLLFVSLTPATPSLDFGLRLQFTPHIHRSGILLLFASPEIELEAELTRWLSYVTGILGAVFDSPRICPQVKEDPQPSHMRSRRLYPSSLLSRSTQMSAKTHAHHLCCLLFGNFGTGVMTGTTCFTNAVLQMWNN
jgi:hypothetical protein